MPIPGKSNPQGGAHAPMRLKHRNLFFSVTAFVMMVLLAGISMLRGTMHNIHTHDSVLGEDQSHHFPGALQRQRCAICASARTLEMRVAADERRPWVMRFFMYHKSHTVRRCSHQTMRISDRKFNSKLDLIRMIVNVHKIRPLRLHAKLCLCQLRLTL